MLDDLKLIHEKDAQDALGVAEKQWQQLEHSFDLPEFNFDIHNIVLSGMGGSALSAALFQTWPGCPLPFAISRDYNIPNYVSKNTLFIASSYSGNTEETLEAFEKAQTIGAPTIVISSGGKLVELAQAKNIPTMILPEVPQPRFAALYGLKALVTIMHKVGISHDDSAIQQLESAIGHLQASVSNWRADVATKNNYAKQLSLDLVGKSVVVYAGPLLAPVARKWKICFNENAKNVAWWNEYPEFNHNEFIGWASHPLEKPYAVLDLISNFEHPRVQKRFKLSDRLLSGRRPAAIEIHAVGETLLEQMLWTVALGDFVSIYLGILNGLNPTPVELVEKFKEELNK